MASRIGERFKYLPQFDQVYPLVTCGLIATWALALRQNRVIFSVAFALIFTVATFLAHPAFQGVPAILETAGPKGYADELRLLRELHRQGRRHRPKRWR